MRIKRKELAARIEDALVRTKAYKRSDAHAIAFHMADWASNLEDFANFGSSQVHLRPSAVEKLLIDFLLHVPEHVAAAAKLMVDSPVRDIFEVGAISSLRKKRTITKRLTAHAARGPVRSR